MMYRMSRYLTFNAVSKRPGPKPTTRASPTNSGSSRICQPGTNWYQIISAPSIRKLMAKSTKATPTAAIGTMRRGKYTLLIRLALPTTLLDASANALEKKVQGSIPAKTMMAYGAVPSDGRLANLLKMAVKTTMVKKGRMTAHAAPITVCLYRTAT